MNLCSVLKYLIMSRRHPYMKEHDDKKTRKPLVYIFLSVLLLSIGGGAGYAISRIVNRLPDDEQKLVDEYRLLKEDWLYGNENAYIGDLAAKGLISAVSDSQKDPYTFYTATEAEQGLSTDGKGFGFASHYYDGGLYITSVFLSSNSYKAGLRQGDVLYRVKVNEDSFFEFKDHSLSEINAKLSSVQDDKTPYVFEGKRNGNPVSFSIVRGDYKEDLVSMISSYDEKEKVLALSVNTFLGNPTSALVGTIDSFYQKGQIDTLVIDLRSNGGGYVSQAKEMAKLFVKKGTLIYQLRDKDGNIVEQERQTSDPKYQIPHFRIIMDSNTASASEIFALAMLCGTDCKAYGFQSYGKGIAQSFKTFSDGSVVRYTYARVYGPDKDGNPICIHSVGITPDFPYTFDYSFLGAAMDLTQRGISAYGQDCFLKILDTLYPDMYPSKYGADYQFTTAIQAYGNHMADKYSDDSLKVAFNQNGGMSKELNDIFNMEEYDFYLKSYDGLTSYVLKGENA